MSCLYNSGLMLFCAGFSIKTCYICKGSFGGRQGQPSARPWHLLIRSLGLAALPPPSVRLLSTEAIAYLITISSSSIDSLCDSCSACLLPTVHPGNTPYITIMTFSVLGFLIPYQLSLINRSYC